MNLILPPVFLTRLESLIPEDKKADVYAALSHPRATGIRVNTIKTQSDKIVESLKKQAVVLTPLFWFKDGYILASENKEVVQDTLEYKTGQIYFQSISSMLVPILLDPQRDEIMLDMCASPGSKTTQIAALMQNTGGITANDRSRQRLFKLRENIRNLGVTNTQVINLPGEMLWRRYPQIFDRVLVDVPCSMEGRFISGVEKSYKDWSPKKSKLLANLQKKLLRSAVSCTKPGGVIIYSTCTLSIEENEEVINWILKKEPGLSLEPLTIKLSESIPGFLANGKKEFDPSLKNTLRILPSETMEGFFVAKLRKHGSPQIEN